MSGLALQTPAASARPAPATPLRPPGLRSLLWQGLLLLAVLGLGWWLWGNAQANLTKHGLELGFGFLGRNAGMPIGESVIPYEAGDTYGRALLVGLLNTLRVAIIGCILAALLGIILGIIPSPRWFFCGVGLPVAPRSAPRT